MKRLFESIALIVVFSTLLASGGCSRAGHERIFSTGDGKPVSFETMVKDIGKAKVIFVGESHDSIADHQSQLEIIEALHEAGISLSVGLEMFRAESQKELDRWVEGVLAPGDFLKAYTDNWGTPWPLYRDIFLYCRDHKIPLVGLNVREDITKKVSRQGFGALTDDELKKLPPGISCDIDQRYMDFIRRAYSVHGSQESSFIHFCEAQLMWDKTMAWHVVEFLKRNPERTVIVLAGVGHSWKRGMPEQMVRFSALPYRVVLPEISGRIDRRAAGPQDADYIVLR